MEKNKAVLVVIGLAIFLLIIAKVPSSNVNAPTPSSPNPVSGQDTLDSNSGSELPKNAQETFSIKEDDAVYGSRNAKYIVFEYSDFQCIFCKRFHPTVETLVDESRGGVVWVYRHLPITSIHPLAREAAIVSECVRGNVSNEAFWTYANSIFSSERLTISEINQVAILNGLSESQIASCKKPGSTAQNKVKRNEDEARRFAFNGTPNGIILRRDNMRFHVIPGAVDPATLRSLIDSL